MNMTSPVIRGAAHAAEIPGDSSTSVLRMIDDFAGLFATDGSDGGLGMVMSGLAGVATALAVAIMLSVYFRSGYRSARDIVKHGLAAAAVLALLAFVAYDMRHAAMAYLGINPVKPAVQFEIRLPRAALSAVAVSRGGQPLSPALIGNRQTVVIPRACGVSSTPRPINSIVAPLNTGSSAFADDDSGGHRSGAAYSAG
jgi:hypothetical protein